MSTKCWVRMATAKEVALLVAIALLSGCKLQMDDGLAPAQTASFAAPTVAVTPRLEDTHASTETVSKITPVEPRLPTNSSITSAGAELPPAQSVLVDQSERLVIPTPPPPKMEVPPASAGYGGRWIPGAWNWSNGKWVWTRGQWVTPPRPNATWEAGQWEVREGKLYWTNGHWR